MNIPGNEAIDIMVSPVQALSTNVFEKQTNSTPLLKDVSFAPVDDTDTSSDSIDDEEIENLLNEDNANFSSDAQETESEQEN